MRSREAERGTCVSLTRSIRAANCRHPWSEASMLISRGGPGKRDVSILPSKSLPYVVYDSINRSSKSRNYFGMVSVEASRCLKYGFPKATKPEDVSRIRGVVGRKVQEASSSSSTLFKPLGSQRPSMEFDATQQTWSKSSGKGTFFLAYLHSSPYRSLRSCKFELARPQTLARID